MKPNFTLTITSLLTILFASFHLSDDVVRGFSEEEVGQFLGFLRTIQQNLR